MLRITKIGKEMNKMTKMKNILLKKLAPNKKSIAIIL